MDVALTHDGRKLITFGDYRGGSVWDLISGVETKEADPEKFERLIRDTLGYLCTRIWTIPKKVELHVEHVPDYVPFVPQVKAMAAAGASVNTIAAALGLTWTAANDALKYASTGVIPKPKPPGKTTGTRSDTPKYIGLAAEVARLRDEESLSFPKIGSRLKINENTARRAYDHAHQEDVLDAAIAGRTRSRGRYVLVSMGTRHEILRRLSAGEAPAAIAIAVGCSVNTIYRLRRSPPATSAA